MKAMSGLICSLTMALSLRTRLYVTAPLSTGLYVPLRPEQVHYLRNVLRLSPGVEVAVFNGRDGEWLGRIATLTKDEGSIEAVRELRVQACPPDLWLLFAPIKRAGIDLIAEKASELGATTIWPVLTRNTDVARVNVDRLQANAIEAAEQSERLCIPEIKAPTDLPAVLADWPAGRPLIVCAEIGPARPIAEVLMSLPTGPAAILVGPEGGFSRAEIEMLTSLPFAIPVRLGPRVLRAETATFAALACWQALKGDWVDAT